jgi:hypothetical protein
MPRPIKPARSAEELLQRPDVKYILDQPHPRHRKNYFLNKLGLTHKEISNITGVTPANVSRDIWGYKTGRLKIPFEK